MKEKTMRDVFNCTVKPMFKKQHAPQCKKCMFFAPWGSSQIDVHHIVPLADGGSNDEDNLIVLCHSCHEEWHAHCEDGKTTFSEWMSRTPSKLYAACVLMTDDDQRTEMLQKADTMWPFVREMRMVQQPTKDDACRRYVEENCGNWVDW